MPELVDLLVPSKLSIFNSRHRIGMTLVLRRPPFLCLLLELSFGNSTVDFLEVTILINQQQNRHFTDIHELHASYGHDELPVHHEILWSWELEHQNGVSIGLTLLGLIGSVHQDEELVLFGVICLNVHDALEVQVPLMGFMFTSDRPDFYTARGVESRKISMTLLKDELGWGSIQIDGVPELEVLLIPDRNGPWGVQKDQGSMAWGSLHLREANIDMGQDLSYWQLLEIKSMNHSPLLLLGIRIGEQIPNDDLMTTCNDKPGIWNEFDNWTLISVLARWMDHLNKLIIRSPNFETWDVDVLIGKGLIFKSFYRDRIWLIWTKVDGFDLHFVSAFSGLRRWWCEVSRISLQDLGDAWARTQDGFELDDGVPDKGHLLSSRAHLLDGCFSNFEVWSRHNSLVVIKSADLDAVVGENARIKQSGTQR